MSSVTRVTRFPRHTSGSQGYTLIEVLIAVVILSIGLLGMAGIQVKGMRGTQNTFLKTTATNLAQNMAERMHANPLAADNTDPSLDNQYLMDSSGTSCGSAPTLCEGASANCTISQMATYDIFRWVCGTPATSGNIGGINNSLPNSVGTITCVDNDTTDADACSPGSTHRITISWDETNLVADPVTGDEFKTQSISINTVP